MRLDHIAYRVKDRIATANFFAEAFDYRFAKKFPIVFADGSQADCIALEPPEKVRDNQGWVGHIPPPLPPIKACETCGTLKPMLLSYDGIWDGSKDGDEYHLAPEIFVSDGTPDSIVGQWVATRDGVGGIHHLAYQVDDVRAIAKQWTEKGWAEFTGDVLTCPEDELEQVFSKPHPLTGVIYEFIKRGEHGFCEANVQRLMKSTEGNQ